MCVCAVIAFPLGASLPEDKVYEARRVIDNGATEVDMVINLGALKSESFGLVLNDILFVTQEAHARGTRVKVIIEAALLTRREKILACLFAHKGKIYEKSGKTRSSLQQYKRAAIEIELARKLEPSNALYKQDPKQIIQQENGK